jgi:hypothetical protein
MKRAVLIDVRPLDPVVNQYMTPAVQKEDILAQFELYFMRNFEKWIKNGWKT